ncbi:hypothetical protein ACLOJK_008275 [Asimina triloba]
MVVGYLIDSSTRSASRLQHCKLSFSFFLTTTTPTLRTCVLQGLLAIVVDEVLPKINLTGYWDEYIQESEQLLNQSTGCSGPQTGGDGDKRRFLHLWRVSVPGEIPSTGTMSVVPRRVCFISASLPWYRLSQIHRPRSVINFLRLIKKWGVHGNQQRTMSHDMGSQQGLHAKDDIWEDLFQLRHIFLSQVLEGQVCSEPGGDVRAPQLVGLAAHMCRGWALWWWSIDLVVTMVGSHKALDTRHSILEYQFCKKTLEMERKLDRVDLSV